MAESKTSPRRITAKERHIQALDLRKKGYTLQAIADELGFKSPQAVHKAITSLLNGMLREPTEELRTMELERLNDLYKIASVQAGRGNLGALDRCIRIMERRAKLLGLDAPARTDITSGGEKIKGYIGVTPDEWDG